MILNGIYQLPNCTTEGCKEKGRFSVKGCFYCGQCFIDIHKNNVKVVVNGS